jgi:hypothetical protein
MGNLKFKIEVSRDVTLSLCEWVVPDIVKDFGAFTFRGEVLQE